MVPRFHIAPIVLVEDDADDIFFVRRSLERAPISNPLMTFSRAEQARHHFSKSFGRGTPALFILDVKLTGAETGLDFLRWLRMQKSPLGSTPAMMLTASDRPEDRQESSQLGAIFFLRKPVSEETLTAAVQALGFIPVYLVSGHTAQRIIERRDVSPY